MAQIPPTRISVFPIRHRCGTFGNGHGVHPIPATRSATAPHEQGRLVAVEGVLITVVFEDEVKDYRNHDPNRLIDIVGLGGRVDVCEHYRLLRARGTYYFSIGMEPITRGEIVPARSNRSRTPAHDRLT